MRLTTTLGVLLAFALLAGFFWLFPIGLEAVVFGVISVGLIGVVALVAAWTVKRQVASELIDLIATDGLSGLLQKLKEPNFRSQVIVYASVISIGLIASALTAQLALLANVAVGLLQANRIGMQTDVMRLQTDKLTQSNAITEANTLSLLDVSRKELGDEINNVENTVGSWGMLLFGSPSEEKQSAHPSSLNLNLCRTPTSCPDSGEEMPIPERIEDLTNALVNEVSAQHAKRRDIYAMLDNPGGHYGDVNGYKAHLGQMTADARQYCGINDVVTKALLTTAQRAREVEEAVETVLQQHVQIFEELGFTGEHKFKLRWPQEFNTDAPTSRDVLPYGQFVDDMFSVLSKSDLEQSGVHTKIAPLFSDTAGPSDGVEPQDLENLPSATVEDDALVKDDTGHMPASKLLADRGGRSLRMIASHLMDIYSDYSQYASAVQTACSKKLASLKTRQNYLDDAATKVKEAGAKISH